MDHSKRSYEDEDNEGDSHSSYTIFYSLGYFFHPGEKSKSLEEIISEAHPVLGWIESSLAGQCAERALRLRSLSSLTLSGKLAFERRSRHGRELRMLSLSRMQPDSEG